METGAVPLQRDILVIALALGIAASLYVVSFRDLMAFPPSVTSAQDLS